MTTTTDLRGGKYRYECVAHMGDMNPIMISVRADDAHRAQAVTRDYVVVVMGRPMPKRIDVKRQYETRQITTRTGIKVDIGTAEDLGLDSDGGEMKWYTVCVDHGTCIGHRTRRLADSHGRVPEQWCEYCDDTTKYCVTCANDASWCDHGDDKRLIVIHDENVSVEDWAKSNGLDLDDDNTFNSYSEWKANQ